MQLDTLSSVPADQLPCSNSALHIHIPNTVEEWPATARSPTQINWQRGQSVNDYLRELKFEEFESQVKKAHQERARLLHTSLRYFHPRVEQPPPPEKVGPLWSCCCLPPRPIKKSRPEFKQRKCMYVFFGFLTLWPLVTKGLCGTLCAKRLSPRYLASLRRVQLRWYWKLVLALLFFPIPAIQFLSAVFFFTDLYPARLTNTSLECLQGFVDTHGDVYGQAGFVNVFEALVPLVAYIIVAITYSFIVAFPAYHEEDLPRMPVIIRTSQHLYLSCDHLHDLFTRFVELGQVSTQHRGHVNTVSENSVFVLIGVLVAIYSFFPFVFRMLSVDGESRVDFLCGHPSCCWQEYLVVGNYFFSGTILLVVCYGMMWMAFLWAEFMRVSIVAFTNLSTPRAKEVPVKRSMFVKCLDRLRKLHKGENWFVTRYGDRFHAVSGSLSRTASVDLNLPLLSQEHITTQADEKYNLDGQNSISYSEQLQEDLPMFMDLTVHQNIVGWTKLRDSLLKYLNELKARRIWVILNIGLLSLVGITVYQIVEVLTKKPWERASRLWTLLLFAGLTFFLLLILWKTVQINELLHEHKILLEKLKITIQSRKSTLRAVEDIRDAVSSFHSTSTEQDVEVLIDKLNATRLFLRISAEEVPFIQMSGKIIHQVFDIVLDPLGFQQCDPFPAIAEDILKHKAELLRVINFFLSAVRLSYPSISELENSDKVVDNYMTQIKITDRYFRVLGLKIDLATIYVAMGTLASSGFVALVRAFQDSQT